MTTQTIDLLRRADWLTKARVTAYARIFVGVLVLTTIGWVALSKGMIDIAGHPIGTDFLNVYAAGLLADAGRAADAYDWHIHGQVEASVIAYDGYFGWHYPPVFLFLAAPLASLPYAVALGAYLAATFAAYLAAMTYLGGRMTGAAWLAAGFPAVFVNLGHGQNGFLTAALLAAGFVCLEMHPLAAGLFLGCLVYKPQFALLLPVALLAGGYWRTAVAACATAALLSIASLAVFGEATWLAFFASLEPTRTIILEQGATGWPKIVSVFSAVRLLGGGIEIGYVVQTCVTLAVMGLVGWVWWRSRRLWLGVGCLALAIPLTTPYVLDYDLMVLAVGVFALAREGLEMGFRPWERSVLALVTVSPLLARAIGTAFHLPIMPPVLMLALVVFSMRTVARHLEMRGRFAILPE
jgi:hypothetical protein